MYEQKAKVRQAILKERTDREYKVRVALPHAVGCVNGITVYAADVHCTVHRNPCQWVDAGFCIGENVYVVLLDDLINSGMEMEHYIKLALVKERLGGDRE